MTINSEKNYLNGPWTCWFGALKQGSLGRQQTVKLSKRPRAQPKSQTHLTATVFRHTKAEKATKFPDLALYQTRTNLSLGPAQARPEEHG